MRKLPLYLLAIQIICTTAISAQSNLPAYGVFTDEEVKMKECSFEKNAEAIVLLDDAFTDYDDNGMITTRRTRIKILNERGIDHGNITIHFYSKDDIEYIRNIEGMSFTENGAYMLDPKSIYTDKGPVWSKMKFAMPNVKAGTIIEYKYEVFKKYYDPDEWSFQTVLPTMKSCYMLRIHPRAEFSYVVSKKNNYPVTVKQFKDDGKIYFEMNHIPSLQFEPYMDASRDYLQRVEFQLAGYVTTYGAKTNVNNSWKDIAYNLATDKELGNAVKKDLPRTGDLKPLVLLETTEIGKLTAIYNYVRKNFTWNGYMGIVVPDGLKKVCETRTGSVAAINLVLVSLLHEYGIEAYPLIVAERDYGRIDPRYPLIERFNKTMTYATVDGKEFIMDATQKYCPVNLTPFPLLNTYALLINKKTTNLIEIASKHESYKTLAVVKASLDKTGLLSGTTTIFDYDYAKALQTEGVKKDEKKFVQKEYESEYEGLTVEEFTYDNINSDSLPLTEHITFNNQFDESGGFVLLNYNLFTGLRKNPFTRDERFTNINFGFPINMEMEATIELPENCKIDALPKNRKITTPDKDIFVSREIQQSGNSITIRIKFVQDVTLVPFEFYAGLQDFYKMMTDMLNEPITVKVK
jgi:hypothetical protein